MTKIAYVPATLRDESLRLVAQANDILEEYRRQGYILTLRQLYYQFVARDLLPEKWADKRTGSKNNEKSYDNLGALLNKARLAGLVRWDLMVDRTRTYHDSGGWYGPADIIRAVANQYRRRLWDNQPWHVEVWVEKDALVDVVSTACDPFRVGYFSCRGYTSQSEMWAASMRLLGELKSGKKLLLIHLGDHDPSGIDMSRDIEDRLKMFVGHHRPGATLDFRRIALNMDQVEQYSPPPNPTKITDSRAAGYIDEYGEECWELDALEPNVINALIGDEIGSVVNQDQWEEDKRVEEKDKRRLGMLADYWELDVADLLAQLEDDANEADEEDERIDEEENEDEDS